MSQYAYDLGAIESHRNTVNDQHSSINSAASGMSSVGAGGKEMYGILIGQIAHPILDHSANGGEKVISELASLLDGMLDGLKSTVDAYRQTEQDHQDRTKQIETELNNIPGVN